MECGTSVNGQASAVHHCQPTRITRQQSHAKWPLVGPVRSGGPSVQAVQACPKEIEGGLHGVVGSHERGVGE